jgi:hypothetical protein
MKRILLLTAVCALGCGSTRFRDQPVVWSLGDTRAIPEPEEREYMIKQYFADIFVMRRLERALELPDEERAWNVNALEEVPDSAWFKNRLGRRSFTPEEIARGPDEKGPPKPPFTIKTGKTGGGALGFVMNDAAGRSFLIKLDRKENPEMQTGSNVVVNRIFHAFGFQVPADYVIDLPIDQLSIDKKATAKDEYGKKTPYTQAMLDEVLAGGPPPKAGVYRATASEYLKGVPKGGFSAEGVRPDDINDVVPHQHRRELRGLRVLAAWTNHTDMKEDNTLDMYIEDGGRKYLRHYLVDFGEALGGHGAEKLRLEDGYEHFVDWQHQPRALFTFGLENRHWENLKDTGFLAFGTFGSDTDWDPKTWREAYPWYPFMEMDRTDAFWAAKIIVKFTREHIEAIVKEARFSEPGAEKFLVDAMEKRKLAIGKSYLEALSPLDDFAVEGGKLCVTDVGVRYGIVRYGVVERLNDDGDVVESVDILNPYANGARACLKIPASNGYAVVKLRSRRGDTLKPPLEVHLKTGDDARVLGLVRDP